MAEEEIKIFWTYRAEKSFSNEIKYIETKWSQKDALIFIDRTNKFLNRIAKNPEICRPSLKRKSSDRNTK